MDETIGEVTVEILNYLGFRLNRYLIISFIFMGFLNVITFS